MAECSQVVAHQVLINDARPAVPSDTEAPLCELIRNCWNRDPQERPSFDDITRQLTELYHTCD